MGAMMRKTLPAELQRVDISQEFNFLILSEEEANLRSKTPSPSFFPLENLVDLSEITALGSYPVSPLVNWTLSAYIVVIGLLVLAVPVCFETSSAKCGT